MNYDTKIYVPVGQKVREAMAHIRTDGMAMVNTSSGFVRFQRAEWFESKSLAEGSIKKRKSGTLPANA